MCVEFPEKNVKCNASMAPKKSYGFGRTILLGSPTSFRGWQGWLPQHKILILPACLSKYELVCDKRTNVI